MYKFKKESICSCGLKHSTEAVVDTDNQKSLVPNLDDESRIKRVHAEQLDSCRCKQVKEE